MKRKILANISYDLTSCNYDDKNIKFWLQHRNILTPFQWVCHTEASQVGDDSLTNHHRVVSHVTQSNLERQWSHIYIKNKYTSHHVDISVVICGRRKKL